MTYTTADRNEIRASFASLASAQAQAHLDLATIMDQLTTCLEDRQAAIDAAVADQKASDDLVIAGMQESIDALGVQVSELTARVVAAQAIIDADAVTIANQDEQMAALEADLAECEARNPAPPEKTLWGANVGGWVTTQGETPSAAFTRIKAGFGRLPIVRWWSNGFPSSWAAVPSYMTGFDALCPDFGADVAGVLAGKYDAAWRNLCQTATFKVHCSYAHEPGNKGCTVADYGRAQERLAAIKADVGNPLVTFGPVLMGGTYNPKRYSVADKFPADQWLAFDMTNIDWIGGDHYQWPNDTAAFNLGYLIDAAKARGKRVLVAETGALPLSKATDQARADWYAGIAALVDANPGLFVGVLTFESDRGPENPPCCLLAYTGAWDSYSPKAATLYRALCTA